MNYRDSQTRAETVGSLLRSPDALRAAASGDPGDSAVLDAAVLDAIKLQRDAGVDVITDGELRRSNWADTPDFLDCFDKIAGNTGGLRWRGGENSPAGIGFICPSLCSRYDRVPSTLSDQLFSVPP